MGIAREIFGHLGYIHSFPENLENRIYNTYENRWFCAQKSHAFIYSRKGGKNPCIRRKSNPHIIQILPFLNL